MTSGLIPVPQRTLTPAQYGDLADVPPQLEWLANITNPKTRHAYKRDVSEFSVFNCLAKSHTIANGHARACDCLVYLRTFPLRIRTNTTGC